jgi:hypothetical protein
MLVDSVVEGARWALIAVFVLAVTEKGTSLWTRAAAWHPLMLVSSVRRRRAHALMAAALIADFVTVALLVLFPVAGAVGAGLLAAAYTALAFPVHAAGQGGCRCFWRVLNTTTKPALLARNAVLLALALTVAFRAPAATEPAGLAVGAGLLAGLAALVAVLDARARPSATRVPAVEQRRVEPGRLAMTDAAFGAPPHGGELP